MNVRRFSAAFIKDRRRMLFACASLLGLITTLISMSYVTPSGVLRWFSHPRLSLLSLMVFSGCFLAVIDSEFFVRARVEHSGAVHLRFWQHGLFAKYGWRAVFSPGLSIWVSAISFSFGAWVFGYSYLPWVILLSLVPLLGSGLGLDRWRSGTALDVQGSGFRNIRSGFVTFFLVGALFFPSLGLIGLIDPWETHYAEVAREILSRNDWLSLWWAQDGFFWSKPILIFWAEALSMGLFGVAYLPDSNPVQPEWAVRLPACSLALIAVLFVHRLVVAKFGKRSAVLVSLVLATCPLYGLLARQSITDMPFVATMLMAMVCFSFAICEEFERLVKPISLWRFKADARHLLIFMVLMLVVSQALYLISRNFVWRLDGTPAFAFQGDHFLSGSAGNGNVPGNPELKTLVPVFSSWYFQPFMQGLFWLCLLCVFVVMTYRERRAQSLYMFGFYGCCALSFMAKGLPGFVLPGLVALLYLVVTRRFRWLVEGRFRVGAGILMICTIGLPWFIAMYMRHGSRFTDRLLIHDHINRLASGVHGDNGSVHYFLRELGYATFPWGALIPAALLYALYRLFRSSLELTEKTAVRTFGSQQEILLVFSLWFMGAFTLFSLMMTKFHHYVFPVVPPAAVLVGLMLASALFPNARVSSEPAKRLGDGESRSLRLVFSSSLLIVGCALLVLAVAGAYGDVRGVLPSGAGRDWVVEHGFAWWQFALLGGSGLAMVSYAFGYPIRRSFRCNVRGVWSDAQLVWVLVASSAVIMASFIGRDLSWAPGVRPEGYERLIQLFSYKYVRVWPTHLDYRPILFGFAIVSALLFLLIIVRRFRFQAVLGLVSVSLMFSLWTNRVYMQDVAPHWGLRNLVKRYYRLRSSKMEPLASWQMNWKGENFYTGNRSYIFQDLDNKNIRKFFKENVGKKMFFLFEHKRRKRFEQLVGKRVITSLSNKRDDNKFQLVSLVL